MARPPGRSMGRRTVIRLRNRSLSNCHNYTFQIEILVIDPLPVYRKFKFSMFQYLIAKFSINMSQSGLTKFSTTKFKLLSEPRRPSSQHRCFEFLKIAAGRRPPPAACLRGCRWIEYR
eukprot:SAG31_NODE_7881_length_1574_cov_9.377627_1_plen_118_part_00